MLGRLEMEARKKFDAEQREYLEAKRIADIVKKAKDVGAASAARQALSNNEDPTAAAQNALQSSPKESPKPPPRRRRYTTQDATVEKLGELLCETPRGILVFRDELVGWLRSMDKDGHENDRGFYLEAWNGNGGYTYDRIGRGTVEIEAACVSILGGIQPGPLRAYIAQANCGGAGDDGLLQRLQMLVWPDRGDAWVNVDKWPDTEAKNRAYQIFERLDKLTPHIDGAEISTLNFDVAGQEAFNAWRETFERRFLIEDLPPALEAHLAKYRSLLPSLALIFHLIDTPDQAAVGAQHVARAEAWLAYLETHASRLYAQVMDPGMVAAIALSKRLGDLPEPFTVRDIYRRGWAGLDRDATRKAISVLVDLNHIAPERVDSGTKPQTVYHKNPKLNFSQFPKGSTDKTATSGQMKGFVSFGSDQFRDTANNQGDDEVTI